MPKFCGKCGTKLDEQTGKCPNCSPMPQSAAPSFNQEQKNKKNAFTEVKPTDVNKKKPKKGLIALTVLLVVIAALGCVGFIVYKDMLNIPFVDNIFQSLGLKEEKHSDSKNNDMNERENDQVSTDTDNNIDLGDNYEVPEFDAEEYFENNTTLKSVVDVASSSDVSSESDAYDHFKDRDFSGSDITYDYSIEGEYLGTKEVYRYSDELRPMYQTYYTTEKGDLWLILEVNGSFFAIPVTYNAENEDEPAVIISETDTITSYDGTSNSFYINIPDKSQNTLKKVDRIDAETLETLDSKEIDKL